MLLELAGFQAQESQRFLNQDIKNTVDHIIDGALRGEQQVHRMMEILLSS